MGPAYLQRPFYGNKISLQASVAFLFWIPFIQKTLQKMSKAFLMVKPSSAVGSPGVQLSNAGVSHLKRKPLIS